MTGVPAVVGRLTAAGVERGDLLAIAFEVGVGLGLCGAGTTITVATDDPAELVAAIDRQLRPRWVTWSGATATALVEVGVRVATAWDLATVHRILFGGWRAEPAIMWARLHDLPLDSVPVVAPLDLFSQAEPEVGDPEEAIRPDGYLRPEWVAGGWALNPGRMGRWAKVALEAAALQQDRLASMRDRDAQASGQPRDRMMATARSESAAELLCADLSFDGLPMDRAVAEQIIAGFVGPRPRTQAEADAERNRRDAEVLALAPPDMARCDLRSPLQVKSLLRRIGIEVPDTRAWRLREVRDAHPLVEALLAWRKAERMLTTFGYAWLDENLSADGRLRGAWTGCDGAAGRMTASAGLHNMPAEMRPAVIAEPGFVFVRADLGQIEPRVLAAVSGDRDLARATLDDDLYLPVATQLGVDRATAKVAVLGAMYGQTTGHGATALRGLKAAYPVAMEYLDVADRTAQGGNDLRTYGGRLVRMGSTNVSELSERDARSRAAARGRYGRNAMVQGAAAELFKVWAVLVRARAAAFEARIVLCLHDELLVHAPAEHAAEAAMVVDDCLQEAAHRWAPDTGVRFLAETSVIPRWSDAKP